MIDSAASPRATFWVEAYIFSFGSSGKTQHMAASGKKFVAKEAEIPIAGFDAATEIFVDGYHGVSVNNGVAKIHFYRTVFDPTTEQMGRQVVFTMVVSVPAFTAIVGAQNTLIEQLKADGIIVEAEQKEPSDANIMTYAAAGTAMTFASLVSPHGMASGNTLQFRANPTISRTYARSSEAQAEDDFENYIAATVAMSEPDAGTFEEVMKRLGL